MNHKYKRIDSIDKLRKGDVIRRKLQDDSYEYNVTGRYIPDLPGWQVLPDGRNFLDSDGVLFYLKSEDIVRKGYEVRIK